MAFSSIVDMIEDWNDEVDYNQLHSFIEYRARKSFNDYLPTKKNPKYLPFDKRFIKWLENVDEKDLS